MIYFHVAQSYCLGQSSVFVEFAGLSHTGMYQANATLPLTHQQDKHFTPELKRNIFMLLVCNPSQRIGPVGIANENACL